jgi:hypothetical protein
MALNFQQVFDKIREIGLGARSRRENLEHLREKATELLEAWANKSAELNEKLERARQADPSLRCAIPLTEPLDAARDPVPAPAKLTLIAADGSQIAPDRHASVLFSLVNVGAIVMRTGSGEAPEIFTDSRLYFDEEVANWTDGFVALLRDLEERKKILELSKQYSLPLITLTDGPLQLWESRESNEVLNYKDALDDYLSVLSQLQELGVITAGYVDKPSSNLLVRLLEIAMTPADKIKDIRDIHPLPGVTDRWLLGTILGAGQRSAIFALQSHSRAVYRNLLALHFFYLNVGDEKHPSLVRVELPKWVADDAESLNMLHATLLDQCRMMGARPYPYILHRAHEIAVVKFEEKRQVEQMLELELRKAGDEMEDKSAKQSAKDLPGRGKK